jgi:hypothetical protein
MNANLNRALGYIFSTILVAFSLASCGGGGGGTTTAIAPSPTVKPAGVTYTAFTEDRVSSGSLTFDIDGGFLNGTTTYTLATTTNGGCSFTSSPTDPDTPVCSPIAGGHAFLLCNSTTGDYFDTVLFKSSVVDANFSEIAGLSLSSVSCGNPLIRTTTWTIDFNADGTVVERKGSGTNGYPATYIQTLFSSTGARYFDYQHRFVLRKLVEGSKTTFFLVDLYENVAGTNTIFNPRIYLLVK